MNTKPILLGGTALIIAFAVGRYSVPESGIKTTEVKVDEEKDKQVHKVVTTVKSPDGTVKTVVTVDSDTQTSKKQDSTTNQSTVAKRSTLNVALLGGYNTKSPSVTYGLSVSKELIGPATLGVYGLSNGIIGLSIGLDF